jgi:hypothetical protein
MRAHGTRSRYVHGCRCRPCRDANTDYENRRSKLIVYGQWTPFRPAGITVQRVEWLRREGMGLHTIAELAGTHRSVLQKLLRGETCQVRIETQTAVMAIEPTLENLRPSTLVDAAPTWRLVRGFLAVGFTKAEIGRWVTKDPRTRSLQLHTEKVSARNAAAVADLHARWVAGEIVPASVKRRRLSEPVPVERATCEVCDTESMGGGRWCRKHYFQRPRRAS